MKPLPGDYVADVQIPGQKTLVLDPSLAGPLGLVTEVAALKVSQPQRSLTCRRADDQNQSVEKMFWLESGPLSVSTRNVVWLCRPKLRFMRIIAGPSRDASELIKQIRSAANRAASRLLAL